MPYILQYKNFRASITFDQKDRIFYGFVVNSSDSISFHGENFTAVSKAFRETIDDYIAFCREVGK